MRITGNFVWFIFFGGWFMWLLWLFGSLLMFVSIIGIPFGRACYNLSELAAAPVGREVVNRYELTQKKDIGTSLFGLLGNIVWFIFAGFWLALAHVLLGIGALITIIGIPFGIQHFKLAGLSLMPIGKTVVSKELAQEARQENARTSLKKIRSGVSVFDVQDYSQEGSSHYVLKVKPQSNQAISEHPATPNIGSTNSKLLSAIPIAFVICGGVTLAFALFGDTSKKIEGTRFAITKSAVAESKESSENPCKGLDTSITSDMMSCLGLRYEIADTKLNKVYTQVMAGLGAEQKQALKKQQIQWIKAKERECPLVGSEVSGGSLESVLISDCFTTRTEKRLSELKTML